MIFAEPVGDGLRRPFGVAEDGGFRALATRTLGVRLRRVRVAALAGLEVHDLTEEINRVVVRHATHVNPRVDADAQVAIEFAPELIETFFVPER